MLTSTLRSLRAQTVRNQETQTDGHQDPKDPKKTTRKHLGWLGWFLLVLVLTVAVWTRSARLGEADFHSDENYHVRAAQGYLRTSLFYEWDFLEDVPRLDDDGEINEYIRSPLTTLQVAGAFHLFGISETAARIPSVFWGVLGVLGVFFCAFWLTRSVAVACFSGLMAAFYPELVLWSRTVRMYAALQTILPASSLALVYGILRARSRKTIRWQDGAWVVGGLIGLVVAFNLHLITLSVVPGLALTIALILFIPPKRTGERQLEARVRWMRIAWVGGIMMVGALLVWWGSQYAFQVGLRPEPAWEYFILIWRHLPFPWIFLSLLSIGIVWTIYKLLRGKARGLPLYLIAACWIIPVSGLVGFAFATTRYVSPRYVLHFIPFLLVVTGVGLGVVLSGVQALIKRRWLAAIISGGMTVAALACSAAIALPGVPASSPWIRKAIADAPITISQPSYSKGFQPIAEKATEKKKALIIPYREYYLEELGIKPNVVIRLPLDAPMEVFLQLVKDEKPALVVWPEVTIQHISKEARQCVRFYGEDVSTPDTFVHVYQIDAKDRQKMIASNCQLSGKQEAQLRKRLKETPPRAVPQKDPTE